MPRDLAAAILSLAVSLIIIASTPAHAAGSCQPVYNALTTIVTAPSHSYSIQTAPLGNGHQRTVEVIYVEGKTYMFAGGQWMLSPVAPNDVLQQEVENEKSGTSTCHFVRDESVNGEAAAVYSMHRETEIANEDSVIWISKTSAPALRQEVDMKNGGTQRHLIARYEYSNVKPPM
jgi:hypothetical protein